MKKFSTLMIAGLLIGVLGSYGLADNITFQQGVSGYAGGADAQIDSDWGVYNFGGSTVVGMWHKGGREARSVLRFLDIFGPGGLSQTDDIQNAKLKIHVNQSGTGGYLVAKAMLTSWRQGNKDGYVATGGAVTWDYRGYNNPNPTDYWGSSSQPEWGPLEGVDYTNDGAATVGYETGYSDWLEFDITDIVIAWQRSNFEQAKQAGDVLDPMANEGILAYIGGSTSNSKYLYYESSENATTSLRPILDITYVPESAGLLEGDANRDGVVSAGDYASVQASFGSTGDPGILGDANGDGVVSAGDYASVQANFGNTAPAVAVPEPVTVSLLILGGGALLSKRKWS